MGDTALFLTDIDGTLLQTNHPLEKRVCDAAKGFREHGGRISVCTGRHPLSVESIAGAIGVSAPAILFGGSMIYDFRSREVLWQNAMKGDCLAIAAHIMAAHGNVAVMVYSTKEIYIVRSNRWLRSRGVEEERGGRIRKLSDCKGEILKIVLVGEDVSELEDILSNDIDPSAYDSAFSSTHFAEITGKGVHKGSAAKRLKEMLDLPKERLYAAGDSMADLPMLAEAGLSFATQRAPEALRTAADYVIPGPELHGMETAFAIATERLQLA